MTKTENFKSQLLFRGIKPFRKPQKYVDKRLMDSFEGRGNVCIKKSPQN